MSIQNKNADAQLSDHELLVQIAASAKASEKQRRTAVILIAVIALLLLITVVLLVPRVIALLNRADQAVTDLNQLITEAEPGISGFSNLDFNSLNNSIQSLTNALSGLSGIFGR